MPCTPFTSTRYLRGGTTHLHLESSSVLVVVPHDVGEESHVVRHPRAPGDGDGLAGEQAVPPHQRQKPGAGEGAQERSHFAELPATGAGLRALCPALASSPPPRRGCGYCPISQRLSPAPSLLRAANTRKSRARQGGQRSASAPRGCRQRRAGKGKGGEKKGDEAAPARTFPAGPRPAAPSAPARRSVPSPALGSGARRGGRGAGPGGRPRSRGSLGAAAPTRPGRAPGAPSFLLRLLLFLPGAPPGHGGRAAAVPLPLSSPPPRRHDVPGMAAQHRGCLPLGRRGGEGT